MGFRSVIFSADLLRFQALKARVKTSFSTKRMCSLPVKKKKKAVARNSLSYVHLSSLGSIAQVHLAKCRLLPDGKERAKAI